MERDLKQRPAPAPRRVADALAGLLAAMGVELAFGVVGGGVAPLAVALASSSIRVLHARHEAGAAFAAGEASLASGRPAVVFATTGPGLTNALTGLFVARREGARVILLSGTTPASRRDRWALQASGPHALLGGIYEAGPLFHHAVVIDHPAQLEATAARLARGLRRPHGFVAHVAVPIDLQSAPVARAPRLPTGDELRPERLVDADDVARCARLLRSGPAMLWVGHGARHCADGVRRLAERLEAPVMSTPRGKGILPEDHRLHVGVTGLGGHAGPEQAVRTVRPHHTLVLGTRLGELSSGWAGELLPRRRLIHVDLDPEVPGRAYPQLPTLAIQAELGGFVTALVDALPADHRPAARPIESHGRPAPLTARAAGPVRPQALVDALQRVVVDGSRALVMAEAGNAFAWTNHRLFLPEPGRYRVGMGWGAMGHAAAGVVGAAAAGPRKVVAVVGDGALLMNCELSTAVRYRLPAVWVVVNDAQYGMVEHGMRDAGYRPVETAIPRVDFVALARALGADGVHVAREADLDGALTAALAATGPFVVDVAIDPEVRAPVASRIDNLRAHGVCAEEETS